MKRIAALVPNSLGVSPGQRVRIETWAPYLEQAGWTVDFYPFEDERLRSVLYRPGAMRAKVSLLLSCYLRQLRLVLQGPPCDLLFVFREAALFGPAILERLAGRLKVPIIYDLDDPVFVPYRSPINGWFSLLKFSRKTNTIFRLSDHVIAINNLIAGYAAKFNPSVSVMPNCVDIERYRPLPRAPDDSLRLVWVGSHSTMRNLESIADPLRRLQAIHKAPLRVIGAGEVNLPGVDVEMRQWSAQTEVASLQDCDVGLVPLPDHPWHRWKFFYKTVQYMATGLPVVARRIGSNSEIIQDGVNGFLVESEDEWYERLLVLANDRELRQRMGEAARSTVVEHYSVQKQMPRLVEIFEQVLERSATPG
ncbi:MAG TPA: glycosyltransferase [Pyrinomonadaceae bacterium]|nr:glycosyltransferase [Pyrinomonadaceae bacterium]